MFTDTLNKFVLVIGLFAVFLVLVNVFAARQQVTHRRAGSFRRHRRRRAGAPVPPMPGETDDPEEAAGPEAGDPDTADAAQAGAPPAGPGDASPRRRRLARDDDEDAPTLLRRMGPQLILSAVALAVAGLALFVMWQVASRG